MTQATTGPAARRLSLFALLPLVLATVVMIGWATQSRSWTTVVPEFPPMVPATAFLIAVLACGLMLGPRGQLVCSVLALGYAAVLVFERYFKVDTGLVWMLPFDQQFVADLTNDGRPARTTLSSFVLLSGGMTLLGLRRPTWVSRILPGALGAAVVVVTWTILLGYLVWAVDRADADYLAGIALPTGVSLLLLGLGLIQRTWLRLSGREQGMALRWWVLTAWVALAAYVLDRQLRVPVRPISNGSELLLGGILGVGTATLVTLALMAAERSRLARDALARANTRLQEREAALARSEELLRIARDGSLDGFLLLGAHRDAGGALAGFSILDANPRAADLFGRPLGALIGRRLPDALPPALVAEFDPQYAQVLATGSPFEGEFTTTGGATPRSVHHQVVRTGDGVAVTLRDVTAARELEQQFRHSQKIEAVGRLASGVAHDFNNMLAVVLGTTEELLADPALAAAHRGDLLAIRQAVERGSELTGRLLAFSRRQPSRRDPVTIPELVHEVAGFARRAMPQGVAIDVTIHDPSVVVIADRLLLEQALMNLLLNSRDAMPAGGTIAVTVDTLRVQAPIRHATGELAAGAWARIEVRDGGHGMSPEVVEKAFEPFFTTKPHGRGSGLGLSTAFGIVRQAEGHLVVAESGRDGTAMQVFLPAAPTEVAGAMPTRSAPPTVPAAIRTERVLVVDDDAQVRDVVSRLLRRFGHDVREAVDGLDGLAQLAEGSHTVLVTDMLMPGMGGAELGRRALERDPRLLVVYVSGYTEDEVRLDTAARPRERFLTKPFTAAELVGVIDELIAGREQRG